VTAVALSSAQEDLVGDYRASLRSVGLAGDRPQLWGARSFLSRFGDPTRWCEVPLDVQLACDAKIHHFVSWLLATQRAATSADYLVARRPTLGAVFERHHPQFHSLFVATATALGFSTTTAQRQWAGLSLASAIHGVSPERLTQAELDLARASLIEAARRQGRNRSRELQMIFFGVEATLFHAGVTDELPRRRMPGKASEREAQWARVPDRIRETATRYLDHIALSLARATVHNAEATLREFCHFVAERWPEVVSVADIQRHHVEEYKSWLAQRPGRGDGTLHRHTIRERLNKLRGFFNRLIEWNWEDAPERPLVFTSDLPIKDEPLPRFLDDGTSTKLLRAARQDDDPFVRLCVELLARTGLRKGELLRLTVDAIVQIGSAYWLRVPVGKLHNDRYIPLHPQLKELLDRWLATRPEALRSNLMFVERGRPIPAYRVERAVRKAAGAAGLDPISPHQLRHTLATQAINRGMSIEAIAALLGHKSLTMTQVYARIADRTVADEYFSVSEKVEALYDQPKALPSDAEGGEMSKLRSEMNRRMLGNGYCARPVELDCHFETICESCTFFVTTLEFRPTLEAQRDDAATKGQVGRQKIFDGLLSRLEEEAS
jgi:site-specific recombinase XerD